MNTVLRYEATASDIYQALQKLPRTGWVIRSVKDPESVYDHTVSVVKLAAIIGEETGLTPEQVDDLQHILEVHDWAEAIAGDEFIPNEDSVEYDKRKKRKAKREADALAELLHNRPYQETVHALFARYEEPTDDIAQLAKEIDKYQALELALHYEKTQNIPLFEEFYDYYKRDWPFTHPAILSRIDALQAEHADYVEQK